VKTTDFGGETAYVLEDGGGARAWVLPTVGNNCIAFQTTVDGQVVHLLSTPSSPDVLRQRPTFWGFPILSPYPGRHQTPFTWRGKRYEIVANDRPGVAIHGIVAGAPWEVLSAAGAVLTCRFDSQRVTVGGELPGTGQRRSDRGTWPWPFTLTTTHRVEDGALYLEVELLNRSEEVIPHLLGLHPYFPLRFTPAGTGGAAEATGLPTAAELAGPEAALWRSTCLVGVEADELWEMKAGLGTGTILPLEQGWDLRQPQAVAELEQRVPVPSGGGQFGDDARVQGPRLPVLLYGKRAALRAAQPARAAEPGGVTATLIDLASKLELRLETSLGFGSLALFCPPERPFLSLEPRSAVSDALALMNDPRGLDTGVCPLGPGERWRAWVRLSAAPLRPPSQVAPSTGAGAPRAESADAEQEAGHG
jgi:galactose mutarotase-like enzyme